MLTRDEILERLRQLRDECALVSEAPSVAVDTRQIWTAEANRHFVARLDSILDDATAPDQPERSTE